MTMGIIEYPLITLPYYGSQSTSQNDWADKIRQYLGLRGNYLNSKDTQLQMFSRMFGYKDVDAFVKDAQKYGSIDAFVTANAKNISIPFDVLLKTAPDQIKELAGELKTADDSYEKLTNNPAADKKNPKIAEDHARASLDRLEKTVRLRSDLQRSLDALKEKGIVKDSAQYKEIEGLIKECDGQIQKEIEFLGKLAKENPGVLNLVEGRGIKLPGAEVDYDPGAFSLMSGEEEKEDTIDFGQFLFQYKSPYEYWLDPKKQQEEIDAWKETITAIYKKNDEFKKIIQRYYSELDLSKILKKELNNEYRSNRFGY